MTEYLLYLYAESPVHAGAADSVDVLDLPVQREAATGYPVIWGQSLKGALRQAAVEAAKRAGGGWDEARVKRIFGSAVGELGEDGGTTSGQLNVGDAQLVVMPVPTLRRTFAWVSSAITLGRLARKYAALGRAAPEVPAMSPDRGVAAEAAWATANDEVLGPCLVSLSESAEARAWAQRLAADALDSSPTSPTSPPFAPFATKLSTDLLVVGSDIIGMLLRECTEQSVRVQLDEHKTVENGPFYSEYLPTETILAASLLLRGNADTQENRDALNDLLHGKLLQVGGDETLGKGLVWGRLLGGEQ
ncbi:MAG: type III-B CRISPR module RAMP protein Cmr4 [Pseudonocardiaceae bacterium]